MARNIGKSLVKSMVPMTLTSQQLAFATSALMKFERYKQMVASGNDVTSSPRD